MTTPFVKVVSGDQTLNTVQENVARALKPVTSNPLLDGRVVGPVSFTSGSLTMVPHGLDGRRASQLNVLPMVGDQIARFTRSQSRDERFLSLTADADVTVSFLVF